MVSEDALKGSLNPKHAVDTIKYRINFMQEHPFWFDPDGIVTFIGSQGSGKTLSAVSYTRNLLEMYPECIFVSNVAIKGYDIVFFKDWFANNNFQTLEQFIEEGKILNNNTKEKRNVTYEIEVGTIKAPVKVGDIVGKINVIEDGKTINKVDITVKNNIDKANILTIYYRNLKNLFNGF